MKDYYPEFWDIADNVENQQRDEKIKQLGITKAEYWNHLCREEIRIHQHDVELSESEESYRRGYCHGFYNSRLEKNKGVTPNDLQKWRNDYTQKFAHPPGSNFFLGNRK